MLTVVPALPCHAIKLAPNLRLPDVAELAANGRTPMAGLLRCVGVSALAYAILDSNPITPIALFGFAEIDAHTACPWMLAAPALTTKHRAWLLRNTQMIVQSGDHRWSRFSNRVDARNSVHIRWLRWAGFTVGEAEPFGPLSLPFRAFSRTI